MRIANMQEHHQEFLEGYYFTPSALEKSGPGWLIRAGISQAKPVYHMGPKISPYHYLIFVLEGEGRFVQNRETYKLCPNDLFCLFPNSTHEYYTLKESPMLTVWIAFDGRQISQLLDQTGLRPQSPYLQGAVTPPLMEWFDEFFEWNRSPQPGDSDLFRLSMFYRLFHVLAPKADRSRVKAAPSESWLQKGAEYMQIHYAEGITIDQVSSYIGIDRTHFSKRFAARFGLSPGKYMHGLKMKEAKRLLTETDYKLSEIAQLVGFPDLFSFSKSFKKAYGQPPSRHRPGAGGGMRLPEPFARKIVAQHGKPGEQWLKDFPRVIAYCENKWSMQVHSPYSLAAHFVAPVSFHSGREGVIKLGVPGRGNYAEMEALRRLGGSGAVKLLDADAHRGIILLEKLSPGHSLHQVADDDEATRIAAGIMKRIGEAAPYSGGEFVFETAADQAEWLQFLRSRFGGGTGPLPEPLAAKAEALYVRLNAAAGHVRLIHGDLHHGNILAAGDGRWVSISPKGIVGEAEWEAATYLAGKLPPDNPQYAIDRRMDILAEMLGLSRERMLAWGFCQAVWSACRSVEEDPMAVAGKIRLARLFGGMLGG